MSRKFITYDLGHLSEREVVTGTLRERANVRLIDSSNLRLYERGQSFRFLGGQAQRSPMQLRVPSADHWFVVLDLGGGSGTIYSGVAVSS